MNLHKTIHSTGEVGMSLKNNWVKSIYLISLLFAHFIAQIDMNSVIKICFKAFSVKKISLFHRVYTDS